MTENKEKRIPLIWAGDTSDLVGEVHLAMSQEKFEVFLKAQDLIVITPVLNCGKILAYSMMVASGGCDDPQ